MFSREEKLAHINKSPECVAVHDKENWLNIFSQDAVVEDPVGSRPVTTQAERSAFYDTFIAPNQIKFDVQNDIVVNNRVVRDLNVEIRMKRSKVTVPMHLLYELCEENKKIRINHLAAHWELMPMVSSLFGNGLVALPVMGGLSSRMIKNQGLAGVTGFMAGVGKLRGRGKKSVQAFFQACETKDSDKLRSLFVEDPSIQIPYGSAGESIESMLQNYPTKLTFSKVIEAGFTATASICFSAMGNETLKQGVAVFIFDQSSKKIKELTIYSE